MRKPIVLSLLLLITLFAAACAPGALPPVVEQPTQAPESTQAPVAEVPIVGQPVLPGTAWIMASLNGALPRTESPITLSFGEDGVASGSDGCNRFTTTYAESENTLTFGPIAGTMMACEEPAMSQAAEFQKALAEVTNFTASSLQLVLSSGNEIVMTMIADVQSLDGTAWTVTSINNGRQAVVGLVEGTEISIYFGATELNGNAGCNNYFAGYAVEGNSIAVEPPGSTRRFCETPEGVMEQEAQFLLALQSAATFRIEGNELWLRTAADEIAVIATETVDIDLPAPEPETPTGRVTGATTLNIRSGPGTNYPVIGAAREGDTGTIVGKSADGGWWAFDAPQVSGGIAWASADFIAASNAEDVPVIEAPPPPPTPTRAPATAVPPTAVPATAAPATAVPPTATAVPPPQAQINFWADRTTINLGECATLFWDVKNVQAVWMYPSGADFNQHPVTGQGNQRVCPAATTTYELRVLLLDGTTQFRQVTINVIQPIASPVPPPVADPLVGTRWQVVNINNGLGAVTTLIPGTSISLEFGTSSPGQATGRSGCNTYFAAYQASGNSLTIGRPGTTTLMCDPDVMTQEQQYLAALQSAATFSIQGDTLEIRTAGGSLAVVAGR